ncbi:hypothetical protein F5B22DRAFT_633212 [Xylaria bambusicola]|uniref:uncharacterized protein n=1 Tax=Xylaria bambusicola TaxID=326684 RepID=UPI002008A79B|nr:uncharacterized protein F5B22DRAFT_633212 [Xylaria bambusicola]KAI0525803.1 hypothetical protein F5B22DRAFT_633212 [Xylaria bambusicola]
MAYFDLEARSRQLNAEILSKFQGTAKIASDCLFFDPEGEMNKEKTNRLVDIFKREGCDRLSDSHAIPGNITANLLSAALRHSNLSTADLRGSEPPVLRLPKGTHVSCLHGKHRVEALRRSRHLSPWWTVKLYVAGADPLDLSPKAVQLLAESFANEGQFSDGHIVVKIRSYPPGSIDANRWWTRLSKSKPEILRRLLKHPGLGPALGLVLQIPGLRSGLQLAIWKKIMAENAVEEVVHYLKHIYDTWCYIMGSAAALELVDSDTVSELELRVPGISYSDDFYVSNALRTNAIFRDVTDDLEKERILQRLRQVNYLIPTIHTLQQDFKYLRQCTSVMKQLILGKNRLPVSVQTIVSSAYKSDTKPDHAAHFLDSMKVLYLAIMQNLVELSGEDPLKEDDEKDPKTRPYDQRAWHQLAHRARELGFSSDEIVRLCSLDSDREMARRALLDARPLQQFDYGQNLDSLIATMVRCFNQAQPAMYKDTCLALTTSHVGEPIKRRCGRQYSKAYSNDRLYITLDNFTSRLQKDADITSLFVRRSVFHAFWGGRDDEQNTGHTDYTEQHGVNSRGTDAQDQQMPDVNGDGGSNQDANTQDWQMSDVDDETGQNTNNPDPTREVSAPAPVQEREMRDRPVAVRRKTIIPRHKSRRRIRIRQSNKKNKAPKNISPETPLVGRSSALTTFVSGPPRLELQDTSQPALLQDSRKMMILMRRDGEWEDVKECRRCSVIDAIEQVRDDNPEQDWFLYDKDGRGMSVEQCLTHEDDFICLNTDENGFPADLIL